MQTGFSANPPNPEANRLMTLVRELLDMPLLRESYDSRLREALEQQLTDREFEELADHIIRGEEQWLGEERTPTESERRIRHTVETIRVCIQSRFKSELVQEVGPVLARLSETNRTEALAQVMIDGLGPGTRDLDRRFAIWLLESLQGLTFQLKPEKLGDRQRGILQQLCLDAIHADEPSAFESLHRAVGTEFSGADRVVVAMADLAVQRYTPAYAMQHLVSDLLRSPILSRGQKQLRGWRPLQDHVVATLTDAIRSGAETEFEYPELLRNAVQEFSRPELLEDKQLIAAAFTDLERLVSGGDLRRIAEYAKLIAETRPRTPAGDSWRRMAGSFAAEVAPLIQRGLSDPERGRPALLAALNVHHIFCGN